MAFDLVASTGRTGTTYLASALNGFDDVCACHEGYVGSDKTLDPLLPLINLENAQSYALPSAAARVVAAKRGTEVLAAAMVDRRSSHLIDVAYYNATLATALLDHHRGCRLIGIIRRCESFVRSATTLEGEDPLPVGWPDPDKPMTDREKFIAMGRIRPRRGSQAKAEWADWSAIRRNIWLWHETNLLLIDAREQFPERVRLCRFETLRAAPQTFWAVVADLFDLDVAGDGPETDHSHARNKKPAGYQVGPESEWTAAERSALHEAQKNIDERARYAC